MTSTTSSRSRRRSASSALLLRRIPLALILFLSCVLAAWRSSPVPAAAAAVDEKKETPSAAEPINKKRGVITLDAKNFDSSLRDGKVWLIEFYAPWCGHCVRFASTYEAVANQLHARQITDPPSARRVNVAKVDGAAERALASRFGVAAFPTFFLVDGWTVREFEGSRSHEGLTKFALTTYGETEPVPFLFGPFGPMGQLKGWLMRCGTWAIGMYEGLTEGRGYSPLVAMAILCVGGLVSGLVAIVVVGLLFLPKAKVD